jgi:hypothetical protein
VTREHHRRRDSGTRKVLLLALGAVAGLAIGLAVIGRTGTPDGRERGEPERGEPERGGRRRRPHRHRADVWGDDEHSAPPVDDPTDTVPVSSPPSAAALETRVLEAFRNDPLLGERNIDIEADEHGGIELTGWVEDASEIAYALTVARGVPSVRGATSQLAVLPER